MNHYVITRTATWRVKAKSWDDAKILPASLQSKSCDSDEWEMVEEETGREEHLYE